MQAQILLEIKNGLVHRACEFSVRNSINMYCMSNRVHTTCNTEWESCTSQKWRRKLHFLNWNQKTTGSYRQNCWGSNHQGCGERKWLPTSRSTPGLVAGHKKGACSVFTGGLDIFCDTYTLQGNYVTEWQGKPDCCENKYLTINNMPILSNPSVKSKHNTNPLIPHTS